MLQLWKSNDKSKPMKSSYILPFTALQKCPASPRRARVGLTAVLSMPELFLSHVAMFTNGHADCPNTLYLCFCWHLVRSVFKQLELPHQGSWDKKNKWAAVPWRNPSQLQLEDTSHMSDWFWIVQLLVQVQQKSFSKHPLHPGMMTFPVVQLWGHKPKLGVSIQLYGIEQSLGALLAYWSWKRDYYARTAGLEREWYWRGQNYFLWAF